MSVSGTGSHCHYCLVQLGLRAVEMASRTSLHQSKSGTVGSHSSHPEGILREFGDYELICEIARGGMGVVYRARQKSLNREVAVKLILAGQLASPELLERFRIEAQAAAQLKHPGIVQVFEIGEIDTQHFFSMELIEGVSLSECMGLFQLHTDATPDERTGQQRRIALLMSQMARALDFAHQHGVLHRDIKPSNILIDEEELPHLTDFGLAKLTGQQREGLTLTNAVLGTPGYMSPEQASGSDDITITSDVYGLGATLYELLTTRPPFGGKTAVATIWQAIHEAPPDPVKLNPAIDRDLATIAMRCLEKKPCDRYATAVAVAEELERFLQGRPILARPVGVFETAWRWCRRRRLVASLLAFTVTTILVGAIAVLWQWRRAEAANDELAQGIQRLKWDAIDDMRNSRQAQRALAGVAALLRENPKNRDAAAFGMSLLDQHRFPVPFGKEIRHSREFTIARLNPAGTRIATGTVDGIVQLWDAETQEPVSEPLKHDGAINWLEFSPDGKSFATCAKDKTVRIVDGLTGVSIVEAKLVEQPANRIAFSADGQCLLVNTPPTVSILKASDLTIKMSPTASDEPIVAAQLLQNGTPLFTAKRSTNGGVLLVQNIDTGAEVVRLETEALVHAAVNSSITRAVTLHADRGIIWDLVTRKKIIEFRARSGRPDRVLFASSGDRFATFGFIYWVQVWDTETGLPVTPELPHAYFLKGLNFASDDTHLLTWADDSLAQLWDVETGDRVAEPMRHAQNVQYAEQGLVSGHEVVLTTVSHGRLPEMSTMPGVVQLWRIPGTLPHVDRRLGDDSGHEGHMISHDGKLLAIGRNNGEVWVVERATGDRITGPLKPIGRSWGILFSKDGRRLITTTNRGQVAVWSLPSGELIGEPVKLETRIQPSALADDGLHFATGSTDGYLRLWSVETGQIVFEMRHGSEINALAFSRGSRLLASAGEDHRTLLWDTSTGKLLGAFTGHRNEIMQVIFAPDGNKILTASLDHTACIWDVNTRSVLHTLPHYGEVIAADWSFDGRWVATGSRDHSATIWNAATGQPHSKSLIHEQAVNDVIFSPDGRRLMTRDVRGFRLWNAEMGTPLTVTLRQVSRGSSPFNTVSYSPQFTPDGNYIFSAGDSPHAYLWHVPVFDSDPPDWFPEFFESVAGLRVSGSEERVESVRGSAFLDLQERLLKSTDQDAYSRWAREWLKR